VPSLDENLLKLASEFGHQRGLSSHLVQDLDLTLDDLTDTMNSAALILAGFVAAPPTARGVLLVAGGGTLAKWEKENDVRD